MNTHFFIISCSTICGHMTQNQDKTGLHSENGGILIQSNIGLQFYSVSTTVMKSFCKKPLLDVVLKSQVVVRFLRY